MKDIPDKENWKIYFKVEDSNLPWLVSNDGGKAGHRFHYEEAAIEFCKKMNEKEGQAEKKNI